MSDRIDEAHQPRALITSGVLDDLARQVDVPLNQRADLVELALQGHHGKGRSDRSRGLSGSQTSGWGEPRLSESLLGALLENDGAQVLAVLDRKPSTRVNQRSALISHFVQALRADSSLNEVPSNRGGRANHRKGVADSVVVKTRQEPHIEWFQHQS
ncbi:MAG TPA: hypothetical protein VIR30_15540 [Nocardioides sp.]